jgi:DNA-directed RNA polymerase subunit N (RpoN/RPB10)
MAAWRCAIEGCGAGFETAERLIRHQADEHDPTTCQVCGQSIPAGYLAIRHAVEAHTRAEYLRAYAATTDDVRARENVADRIEAAADVSSVLDALGIEAITATGEE